jgi:hypothetical protein
MKIKYAGPRPQISHHGVSFKEGKEDKYVYLMIALQILKAIDKDYEDKKSYSYDLETERLSNDEMLNIITSYKPDLEEIARKEAAAYGLKLDEEVEEVEHNSTLSEVEKKIWINNLNIMKEYRIQRAVNKIYYMHAIEFIAAVIKREGIKEIDTPFYEKYWHVLQTIEGQFSDTKTPISTELKVEPDKEGQLIARMFITGV